MSEASPAQRNQPFDAVTLEILWRRAISAVDEAAKALRRTSFSTLVNESNDFACVLTDAAGQSLAQNTESIPSFIGTLPVTVKEFIKQIGLDNMRPGDVLVTNTPWIATGHLNDITVAKPIFRNGRIVAFAASTAHAPDIGGKVRSVEPREVFEEGFHIPVMKFMSEGKPDRTFLKLLRAAVRTPDQTEGDLWAQITGLDLLERRLGELMTEYGLDDLEAFAGEILGRCERAMRAAIAALPDGTYTYDVPDRRARGALHLQHRRQGRGRAHPRRLRGHLTPSRPRHQLHDDLHLRHDGLCAEMRAAAEPAQQRGHLPLHRGGGARRVDRQSALPGGGRRAHGDRPLSPFAVFGALHPCSRTGIAACGSPLWSMIQTGVRANGQTYANVLFFNGGMGATDSNDGQSAYAWPSNVSNVPVELIERNRPLFVHRKELRPGSGGEGQFRGGLGQEIESRSSPRRRSASSSWPSAAVFRRRHAGRRAGARGEVRIDGAGGRTTAGTSC